MESTPPVPPPPRVPRLGDTVVAHDRFVGMGVAAVKRLFSKARKHRKSIIYIDEIDYIGRSRNRWERGLAAYSSAA